MSNNFEIKLILEGLNCANCANKIEDKVNKLNGVVEAVLNFSTSTLIVKIQLESDKNKLVNEIKGIVKKLEPDVLVIDKDDYEIKNKAISKCTDGSCNIIRNEVETSMEVNINENKLLGYIKDNITLIIGALIYIIALVFKDNGVLSILLFAASYLVVGGKVLLTAGRNILRGEIFDENFLMSIATLGAFIIGEYPEAVAVMLFYEVGEMFQGYAVNKSRKSISSLMDIRADYANVIRNDNEVKLPPEEVNIDEILIIKPGERVPLDGIVIEGSSFIDTSALTGESVPRQVNEGNEILAGCINNNGVLRVRVSSNYGESTVARILNLVENASNKKAPTEKFITKFSKVYTPIVVGIAVLVAIIPPLFIVYGVAQSQTRLSDLAAMLL